MNAPYDPFQFARPAAEQPEIRAGTHTSYSADAALLALGKRWEELVHREDEYHRRWIALDDASPESARGGWPLLPPCREGTLFGDLLFLGVVAGDERRIGPRTLRKINREIVRRARDRETKQRLEREASERVLWWIGERRTERRLRREIGMTISRPKRKG